MQDVHAKGARVRFGLDAPALFLWLPVACVGCTGIAVLLWVFLASLLALPFALTAVVCLVEVAWLLYSSLRGKHQVWRRTLDDLNLRGDEQALDLGAGRGAVLLAVARRLPDGRAVGVDIWRPQDQSGNTPDALDRNLEASGLAERVDVIGADVRALPFAGGSFDLVTAGLTLHNLHGDGDRRQAAREAARVLRPGGALAIVDFAGTSAYAAEFEAAGLAVRVSSRRWSMFPPVRLVTARRDGSAHSSHGGA